MYFKNIIEFMTFMDGEKSSDCETVRGNNYKYETVYFPCYIFEDKGTKYKITKNKRFDLYMNNIKIINSVGTWEALEKQLILKAPMVLKSYIRKEKIKKLLNG